MEHSLELLRDLPKWKSVVGNYPLVVGTSRKSFIGRLVHEENPAKREFGTGITISLWLLTTPSSDTVSSDSGRSESAASSRCREHDPSDRGN